MFHEVLPLFTRAWMTGLGAALCALLYIGVFYAVGNPQKLRLEDAGVTLQDFRRSLSKSRHWLIFVPFFVSVGVFFLWSFSGPALTALYIIESFAIFALGIGLGEKLFRPFAYGLIAFCLVRLVFFDMAEADTLERALVFIVAGAVLLGMNALYNRFAAGEETRKPTP
jgi:hypothetical protein